MDIISKDNFASILSYIDERSLERLRNSSKNLTVAVDWVTSDELYWKKKVEFFLDREYDQPIVYHNWEEAYNTLLAHSFDDTLMIFIKMGDEELPFIKFLMGDDEADPILVANPGADYKMLDTAAKLGYVEIFKALLADPRVDPRANFGSVILSAAHAHNSEILRLILEDGRINPNANNTLFRVALYEEPKYEEIFEILIADPRSNPGRDERVLAAVTKNGWLESVKQLLADPRVDPSSIENGAIRIASKGGRIKIMELLLADPRVDPSANYNEAIHNAARDGRLNVIRLLLTDNRISLEAKKSALTKLPPSALIHFDENGLNYLKIAELAKLPLKELIQKGNTNIKTRNMIMMKYLWLIRLKELYDVIDVDDPFKASLVLNVGNKKAFLKY